MSTLGSYQGAETVTARARDYAGCELGTFHAPVSSSYFSPLARLKNSKFDNKQDLAAVAESFDTGLKETFSDNTKPQFVKFGSPRDNDARCGVKGGKLTLPG